jgi:hypothetical protein
MVLLRIYVDCLAKAGRALGKSPWTALLPMAYLLAFAPIAGILGGAGIVGGFLVALVYDAFIASYLYVVSELVSGSKVRLKEMPQSIRPYFWPLMNVLFVLWIAQMLLGPLLSHAANGGAITLALSAVVFVLLNALPEVIYQKQVYGGLATLSESVGFIQQHWLEWFLPNVPFGLALWFGAPRLYGLPFAAITAPLVLGAFVHAVMLFRGFLFLALDGTTARQRELRYRLGR